MVADDELTRRWTGLEAYAHAFEPPIRHHTRVDRLTREDGRFVATAGVTTFVADHVVVAMAAYQQPKVPAFADGLHPDIVQLHVAEYRNPGQLQDGPVLIVGAGKSGAGIAMELVEDHEVLLSDALIAVGRDAAHVVDTLHVRSVELAPA